MGFQHLTRTRVRACVRVGMSNLLISSISSNLSVSGKSVGAARSVCDPPTPST